MSLNWDDMRYFLALCRTPSFVSAAHKLNVTHSTVARRISALEASLQTQLFQRTEQGCQLTFEGRALLPYAEGLESTISGLENSVSGKNKMLSGCIRLGTPDGLGTCYLAPRLGKFQSKYPAMEIELLSVPMYYSLSKREIDILITVEKPKIGKFIARKLTSFKMGLFATKEYLKDRKAIVNADDLSEHKLIGYIDDFIYDQDLWFREEFFSKVKPIFRSSTLMTQMKAVAAGTGIGVIPYFMAHTEKSVVPVLPEKNIVRKYWLQINQDVRQIARIRTTIDFIVDQIRKDNDLFMSLPIR